MSAFDLQAALAEAAAQSADMNEAQSGGGFEAPAAGRAGARLVAYIEIGKQEGTYQGKPKISDKVFLTFELSGPKWPVREFDDGNKAPQRITVEVNKSLNEKAGFYKLFKAMNWEGKAKIMAQLLGQDFIVDVVHRKYKGRDGKERVVAELFDKVKGSYTVSMPFVEDMDTGESKRRNVPPPMTELKCFLWDHPSRAMWDSIFIDGEYPERKDEKTGEVKFPAKSKNKFQLAIKAAKNFKGSAIEALIDGIDDEALNSVGKSPEEAIAEKKAKAATRVTKEAEPAGSSVAAPEATPPKETASAAPVESDDRDDPTDEELNDLPF
jgi:hypothetical protein